LSFGLTGAVAAMMAETDVVVTTSPQFFTNLGGAAMRRLKRRETFKTVLPSKIFEASAMQKPILLGVDGQARSLVERYGAGLFFEP